MESVDLGSGKMALLLSLTCCQQKDSDQPARSVDTSKILLSSQISAIAGNILSVRRRHLDPASERYNSKLPVTQVFERGQRANTGGDWCETMKASLIFYLHLAIVCNALQISVDLVHCAKEKIDLELQKIWLSENKEEKIISCVFESPKWRSIPHRDLAVLVGVFMQSLVCTFSKQFYLLYLQLTKFSSGHLPVIIDHKITHWEERDGFLNCSITTNHTPGVLWL